MKVAIFVAVISLLTIHSVLSQGSGNTIVPSEPTTPIPSTSRPTTHQPTTHIPTTHKPTTHIPTTHIPTTHKPTTHIPTTHIPTTHKPTTHKPTTHRPITHRPPVDCDAPPNENDEAILLPNPWHCGSYYVCVGFDPILMLCPEGLEFNDVLKVCDWPQSANCTIHRFPESNVDIFQLN